MEPAARKAPDSDKQQTTMRAPGARHDASQEKPKVSGEMRTTQTFLNDKEGHAMYTPVRAPAESDRREWRSPRSQTARESPPVHRRRAWSPRRPASDPVRHQQGSFHRSPQAGHKVTQGKARLAHSITSCWGHGTMETQRPINQLSAMRQHPVGKCPATDPIPCPPPRQMCTSFLIHGTTSDGT